MMTLSVRLLGFREAFRSCYVFARSVYFVNFLVSRSNFSIGFLLCKRGLVLSEKKNSSLWFLTILRVTWLSYIVLTANYCGNSFHARY